MSTTDLARLAGAVATRLDSIHGVMLPLVVLLATAMAVVAVPVVASGGALIILRRGVRSASNWQPKRARRAGGVR
ncbi:hypothetical protein [Streptomyces sp. NBRC 109706]|uniref:hypothetical protein n=1 Tax=Streptomyces sp. NBRC 109706 TaxID=1550035 RepID=UPI000780A2B3|nr:hypothetical protein [Streptomyces sp. NBRC 109706]